MYLHSSVQYVLAINTCTRSDLLRSLVSSEVAKKTMRAEIAFSSEQHNKLLFCLSSEVAKKTMRAEIAFSSEQHNKLLFCLSSEVAMRAEIA